MKRRRILFVDRDGTILHEPADCQIDSFEKIRFVEGVIPALRDLIEAGYELVLVSNQDGLGTDCFPRADFDGPHRLMMQVLNSQGIGFVDELIDPSLPADQSPNRKPEIGMVLDYLKSGTLDLDDSHVIGDRDSDLQLARNMGIRGWQLDHDKVTWTTIREQLVNRPRMASIDRCTRETEIRGRVNLDPGEPRLSIRTGTGFFDHMLEQLAWHAGISLELHCAGDLHIDPHHSVEDTALALGEAIDRALGERRGIGRYGFLLAMDESLANVAIDLSGRPACQIRGQFTCERLGEFPLEMVDHFFRSLSQSLRCAIHIEFRGDNNHHMCEAVFKGTGRALRMALVRQGHELPTTKGVL